MKLRFLLAQFMIYLEMDLETCSPHRMGFLLAITYLHYSHHLPSLFVPLPSAAQSPTPEKAVRLNRFLEIRWTDQGLGSTKLCLNSLETETISSWFSYLPTKNTCRNTWPPRTFGTLVINGNVVSGVGKHTVGVQASLLGPLCLGWIDFTPEASHS